LPPKRQAQVYPLAILFLMLNFWRFLTLDAKRLQWQGVDTSRLASGLELLKTTRQYKQRSVF
jgi:hypothetical protein